MDDKKEKRKAYRREWMKRWRELNKEKYLETQLNYYKKKLEKENTEVKEDGDG